MPKIELSFDELITITSALDCWADELEDARCTASAKHYKALRNTLHDRFAIARVLEETKDPD
jgi:soluble cytochrome b562